MIVAFTAQQQLLEYAFGLIRSDLCVCILIQPQYVFIPSRITKIAGVLTIGMVTQRLCALTPTYLVFIF
jgi:hypothetical protein